MLKGDSLMNIDKVLFLLIIVMPLFKGLFFYHESYFVAIILLLILFVQVKKNQRLIINKGLNLKILTLYVFMYLLSIGFAIDNGMAFMGFMKVFIIFLFYIVLMQTEYNKNKDRYYRAVIYSGVILSIIGLLGPFISFVGQMVFQKGRLGSLIQYANTFGIYITSCIMLLLGQKTIRKWDKLFLVLMWGALILTFSRSIYILSIVVFIIYLIPNYKKAKQIVPASILGVILGYIIVISMSMSQMFNRIQETSFKVSEWHTRLLYYIDGINIIKDYPMGTGHLGYYYLQRIYQTGSNYHVKYIHNHLMQVMLDAGIITGILMLIFYIINLANKKTELYERLTLAIIFFHSIIDIDFEFPIIMFLVLLIIGIDQDKNRIINLKKTNKLYVIIFIWLMAYSYMFVGAFYSYHKEYDKSLWVYPYNTQAKSKLIDQYIKVNESKAYQLSIETVENNNYLLNAYEVMRDVAYQKGMLEEAIRHAEKIIDLNPLNIKHVEIYSKILLDTIKVSIEVGDIEKAQENFKKILDIPSYIATLEKQKLTDYNVKHVPQLSMTKELIEMHIEAERLLINMR